MRNESKTKGCFDLGVRVTYASKSNNFKFFNMLSNNKNGSMTKLLIAIKKTNKQIEVKYFKM